MRPWSFVRRTATGAPPGTAGCLNAPRIERRVLHVSPIEPSPMSPVVASSSCVRSPIWMSWRGRWAACSSATREDRFWKPMLLDPAPPANTTGRGLTVMLAHLTPAPEFDDRVHWLTLRCVGIHGAYRSVLRAHARNWVPTTQNPALQIFLDKSASGHLGSGVFDQGLKEGNECLLPRGSRSRQLAEPADENVLAVARLQ